MALNFQISPIPHEEARKLIADKPAVTREVFDKLPDDLKARAFLVTGIEDYDVLQSLRDRIADLPAGANWDDVKKDVVKGLSPWMTPEAAERRAKLLMNHHGFSAFAAAKSRVSDELSDIFPFRQYVSSRISKEPRASHRALDGLILPADHPFWEKHTPPWEFGCNCLPPIDLMAEDVEEEKARDKNRPPEDRRVLDANALKLLNEGTVNRGLNTIVDVRTPKERGGNYENNVRDLNLPYAEIAKRWDDKTREDFEEWARAIPMGDGRDLLSTLQSDAFREEKIKSEPSEGGKSPFEETARELARWLAIDQGAPSLVLAMSGTRRNALLRKERTLAKKSDEHAVLYNKDGTIAGTAKGSGNEVAMPKGQSGLDRLLTHNHPGGSSFSPQDLSAMFQHRLAEIRVSTLAGAFSLSPVSGIRAGRILDRLEEVSAELASPIDSLDLSPSQSERLHSHAVWSILAEEGLINYSYTPMSTEHTDPVPLSASNQEHPRAFDECPPGESPHQWMLKQIAEARSTIEDIENITPSNFPATILNTSAKS